MVAITMPKDRKIRTCSPRVKKTIPLHYGGRRSNSTSRNVAFGNIPTFLEARGMPAYVAYPSEYDTTGLHRALTDLGYRTITAPHRGCGNVEYARF